MILNLWDWSSKCDGLNFVSGVVFRFWFSMILNFRYRYWKIENVMFVLKVLSAHFHISDGFYFVSWFCNQFIIKLIISLLDLDQPIFKLLNKHTQCELHFFLWFDSIRCRFQCSTIWIECFNFVLVFRCMYYVHVHSYIYIYIYYVHVYLCVTVRCVMHLCMIFF